MHSNCYREFNRFIKKITLENPTVCDVGSRDVNGTFKKYLPKKWKYTGIDIQAGKNVDIVLSDPYDWKIGEQFDIVVSGNVTNHVKDIYAFFVEFGKLLKPNGRFFIISPYRHGVSRWPLDCWRIMPDGWKFLIEEKAGLVLEECYFSGMDIVAIGSKK